MSQNFEERNFWIQLMTSLAVVAGLALVVWELQMTREVSSDQYALQNISDSSADQGAVYGEQAAEVLAKACFEPTSLQNSELIILSHYFGNKINRIYNVRWQARFSDDDGWRGPASNYLASILRYPQGKAYLEGYIFSPDNQDLAEFVKQNIESASVENCADGINRLRISTHDDA